jgi:hypothetical protein
MYETERIICVCFPCKVTHMCIAHVLHMWSACSSFLFLHVMKNERRKLMLTICWGSPWSWSYGSGIYNYLSNKCLFPLTWVRIPLRRAMLHTTLCDQVCQWPAAGRWSSPVSPINKCVRHDIAKILLKMALNTMTLTLDCLLTFPS